MKTTYPLTEWPDPEALRGDIHQLLTVFIASRHIVEAVLAREMLLADFADVREQENRLVARLLLNVAINLRVLDDRSNGAVDEMTIGVGRLFKPIPAMPAESTEVTLREACNKIIHAASVELTRSELAQQWEYLEPTVSLYGTTTAKRAWFVELNAIEFAHEALLALMHIRVKGRFGAGEG